MSDHARALSERGRADAAALGAGLRARALRPDLALVSTSRRTRETIDLLGLDAGSGLKVLHSDALYLATAAGLLDALRELAGEAGCVLLVGHNPGMHELALGLSAGHAALAPGLPTCAAAVFDIEGTWPDLAPGRARLRELLRP